MQMTSSATFHIEYLISLLPDEVLEYKLEGICLEQSVELPSDVISDDIRDRIVGEVTGIHEISEGLYHVHIGYPIDNIGNEITQFLNILFGNISMKPGIRVTDLEWDKLQHLFTGPALGIDKIRQRLNIPNRGISCTALKPLGLTSEELADICFEFAMGGIDIIKDDHGLTNQPYAPFDERVKACVNAVQRAADKTGQKTSYYPNITTSPDKLVQRYEESAQLGADGVLLAPHLCGLEMMHVLANTNIDLPIMAHPSFSGSLVINHMHGFSHNFLYGELWRALGADFVIYANAKGRFSFTEDECLKINESARKKLAGFAKSFPTPGGGMQRKNLKKWLSLYGPDTVFLMGGSLYQHPNGIREAGKEIQAILENES